MDNEETMQLAVVEAKRVSTGDARAQLLTEFQKRKISVDKLLRLDREFCNCKRCKLQKKHSHEVIAKHRVLYGIHPSSISNSESALVDGAAGPSRARSGSVLGSRGSHGSPWRFVSPSPSSCVQVSPALINAAANRDNAKIESYGSSGDVSGLSSSGLDPHPRAVSLLRLAERSDILDNLGTENSRCNANGHTYQTARARLSPTQPFNDLGHLRERLCNIFRRENTPDTIVPDSPGCMIPPDPDSFVEDPGYLEPMRYRSVSAVPSLAGAPPLRFLQSESNSRPNSVASENNGLEDPLGSDLEGDAYSDLLNELDNLDIEPKKLDLDDRPDLNDDKNLVDDEFYSRIDDDADQDYSVDGSVAEDEDENIENEQRERPPVFNDEPDVDPDEPGDANNAAMDEPDLFRNIYIRTWIESIFGGSTREQTRRTLLSHKSTVETLVGNLEAGELADALANALPTMATTFRSLEKRLGINLDDQLVIYALCKACGTRYTMDEISDAELPGCPHVLPGAEEPCGCAVWEERVLYDGTQTRLPLRSFPYFRLPTSLERIVSRPGMRELIARLVHHIYDEDDQPWTKQDWLDAMPLNRKFSDISDGYGRYSDPSGLERTLNEETGVYGDAPGENGVKRLATLPLGLSLAISIDGFNTLRHRGYTSTGVYIVINNLPSHLRTLIENMTLVAVLPGPKEPTAYEFDQMLEPLINDLLELEKGYHMQVYSLELSRCEQKLVHAHLSLARLDYIARMKVCGHAGTTSEENFCLYCYLRRSFLSDARGYKDLVLRNTLRTLDDKVNWLNTPRHQQERLRKHTGVRFTIFDQLPGWYPSTMCPPDLMHLIHPGTTKHIIKSIILLPGLMTPRPGSIYLRFAQGGFPRQELRQFHTRSIAIADLANLQFEQLTSGKAEQYRHLEVVLPVLLFIAWMDDDYIPEGLHPRGARNLLTYKFQQNQADILKQMRHKVHQYDQNPAAERPTLAACASVRSLNLIHRNIICYCVAVKIDLARRVTRSELSYATRLFSRVCEVFTRLNIPLPPNFHYLQHIEAGITRFGSSDQSSTWVFERAHRKLIRVNHNNHTQGTLETTMARGFVKTGMANSLVHNIQNIVNPTADDTNTINHALSVMGNGPEHELQRGRLEAILAGEAEFHGQERIKLATTSRQVVWTSDDHSPYWDMVIEFCSHELGMPVYSRGIPPPRGVCLEVKDSTRCFPYVCHAGIRFGNDFQMRGYTSRYGYIGDMVPVLIKRIYQCSFDIEGEDNPRVVCCAVVQQFVEHEHQPDFPWMRAARRLEIQHWAYNVYNEPEIVSLISFSGSFALGDIVMSYGHYWITFAVKPVDPEFEDDE